MDKNIYCNTVPKAGSTKKNVFSDKQGVICIAVLFVFSLVANVVLVYLYHKDVKASCGPVTACSDLEQEDKHNVKDIWSHPKETNKWTAAHNCPEKDSNETWLKNNGRFYVFSTDRKNWNGSRERCQALGGDLVIIESEEEQDFLANQILKIGSRVLYWSGLTDSRIENEWVWVDNTSQNLNLWDVSPDNYMSPENPEGEDCVVLNGQAVGAKWRDVSCLRKERRICEILCA